MEMMIKLVLLHIDDALQEHVCTAVKMFFPATVHCTCTVTPSGPDLPNFQAVNKWRTEGKMKPFRLSEAVQLCFTHQLLADLHPRCEACLGAKHAGPPLTPQSTCQYCAHLPVEEQQQWTNSFIQTMVERRCGGNWDDCGGVPLEDEADKLIFRSDFPDIPERDSDSWHKSDGSAPSI